MPRKPKIDGQRVAQQAKEMHREERREAKGSMGGKESRFIPARLDHVRKLKDLEEGQVVGVLDTDLAGDETDLPAGRYNLFLRRGEDGEWEAVAERDGRIVSKAARVTVSVEKEPPGGGRGRGEGRPDDLPLPEFREQGWCWCWWSFCGFWVLICICW